MFKFLLCAVVALVAWGTPAQLIFQPIGFNTNQLETVHKAISHWNEYSTLLELGISKNKLINTIIHEDDDVGFTVTTASRIRRSAGLYKPLRSNEKYDIVIDVIKCKYENVLYNVLIHEFGHALGIKHNDNPLSIMNITIHLDSKFQGIDMENSKLGLVDRCCGRFARTICTYP